MIYPNAPQQAGDVAHHYDELDAVYREIWGEHVHHGYWRSGRETPAEATDALADLVAEGLDLAEGQDVVDIGCGYGATAARLAERYGVAVTGFTLSEAQARIAAARRPERGSLAIRVQDWLDNGLPEASIDRAFAIESSEHMVDKPLFFAEAFRVLRPGGRLVVCAWLAGPDPSRFAVRHLLEPICREGRLPSMGSRADYLAMATEAGFAALGDEDLSRQVRKTWLICARRVTARLVTDSAFRRFAFARSTRDRAFMLSLPRLIVALRSGAMRYGLFTWRKPG